MTNPLTLDNARGLMRKISINVLNKDANYTLFTIPVEGVPLTAEQLDSFMGEYTFRSWYEQKKDGSWHPMGWWSKRDNGDFQVDERFACELAKVVVSGDQELEFEAQESDEDDDDDAASPAARITNVVLTPKAGGTTLLAFHMQVRPGIGKTNLALQEHQFRHVSITLGESSVVVGKGKQQSLPLPVVADETGHQSPPPIVSKGGDAIDAEMRARHPEAPDEVMGADAHPDPDVSSPSTEAEAHAAGGGIPADDPATDLAKFEEGAAQRLKDFTAVSETGAIDGTTPRSRRRRRSEDTAH